MGGKVIGWWKGPFVDCAVVAVACCVVAVVCACCRVVTHFRPLCLYVRDATVTQLGLIGCLSPKNQLVE